MVHFALIENATEADELVLRGKCMMQFGDVE